MAFGRLPMILRQASGKPMLGQSIGFNRAQRTSFFAVTGTEQVIAALNREVKKIKGRTRAGMQDALIIVRRTVDPLTPKDVGNLRLSMYTRVEDSEYGPVGVIGFASEYAVYVHEIQKNYKTPGTQWKYLSTALAVAAKDILDAIARRAMV